MARSSAAVALCVAVPAERRPPACFSIPTGARCPRSRYSSASRPADATAARFWDNRLGFLQQERLSRQASKCRRCLSSVRVELSSDFSCQQSALPAINAFTIPAKFLAVALSGRAASTRRFSGVDWLRPVEETPRERIPSLARPRPRVFAESKHLQLQRCGAASGS